MAETNQSGNGNNHHEVIIQTRKLRRVFGKTVAVDGLDLTIYRGEIFGLVGPDGAGKTTTLRLLAAIMDPTSGSATVAGYDTVRDAEAIKERIGYMAQVFSLYGDLSVDENLNFFADVFGVPRKVRQERIERLLEFARLTEFRKRRAAKLSGGMQKKLGLACTLIHEPEILYLDEPTTGVDPVSRREFWDILTDLHVQGVTIVVSTPYMDEAERCSRVGLMYQGQLIECDTPEAIRKRVPGKVLQFLPSDRLKARAILRNTPQIHEVQSFGELLNVFVDDVKEGEQVIREVLGKAGISVSNLRQVQPRMEEAFVSLIRRRARARAGG
ncbi:MAG TPA: ABC transporter ATP-binding protein [Chloroflexi bacterium]|nr:ABC transporter ATP-binding protein [Chloroflexota bacterium]